MRKPIRATRGRVLVAALTAGAFLMSATPANAATGPTVITWGLNNPRQLSLTSDGVLLIAEAGKGGDKCMGEGEEEFCVGKTGAISAVFNPASVNKASPIRVVTDLLSGSGPGGLFAVGSDGVSARKFLGGTIFIQETFAPPDILPSGIPGEQSGKLLYAWPGHKPKIATDISKYEFDFDPDKHGVDSNPYAVLDLGDYRLVADAAANAVFKVERNGNISVFHVFPNVTTPGCKKADPATGFPGYDPSPAFPGCNFVPTSLAVGGLGDIYVGGLVSERPGEGQVVKLDGKTGAVKRVWSGFTTVTGVAVSNDSLYVSQLFAPQAKPMGPEVAGVVTKVTGDKRWNKDVPFPAGLAVDKWNNVFVSAYSVATEDGFPGTPQGANTSGQIWKLKF